MTLWLIIIASLFPVTVEVIYSFVLLRVLRKKLGDLVIQHGNIQEYVTVVFANVCFLKISRSSTWKDAKICQCAVCKHFKLTSNST